MAVQILTDETFETHLKENKKVVVKFFADWCGTCKLFAPKFRRMSENEDYKDVYFAEVNAEESPEVRKKAGVNNLPYVAIFSNGELIEGYATGKEEAVIELLAKLK